MFVGLLDLVTKITIGQNENILRAQPAKCYAQPFWLA